MSELLSKGSDGQVIEGNTHGHREEKYDLLPCMTSPVDRDTHKSEPPCKEYEWLEEGTSLGVCQVKIGTMKLVFVLLSIKLVIVKIESNKLP